MLIIVLSGCGNYIRIGKRKIVGDLKLVQVNHKWRVEGAVDKNIKEIVIPSGYGIKGFYNKAFANYTSLEKVDIQEDIKIIEDQTFAGCVNLKEVILPDSITTIFAGAFSGCESLHITKLPEKLTTIGGCAFKDVHLDSLVFPVGVGIIRDSQLYGAIINNL